MAGKDEFMELGRLILQSEMDVIYIKNLRIEEQVNEHGRMTVRFLSGELPSPEDILRYQGSRVCLTTMEGEIVFCGQCMEIGLIAANAYREIELTAQTLSIQTDKEPGTNTNMTLRGTRSGRSVSWNIRRRPAPAAGSIRSLTGMTPKTG